MSSANSLKVGFIGLGRMGQAMAARILGGGHDLVVYNRTVSKTTNLVEAGALAAPSVAEACSGRDFVISMVADDASLLAVTQGAGGIRESLAPGAVHIVMGTHGASVIQKITAAHSDSRQVLVGAPVLGRPDAAASGQLVIVAGGPDEVVRKCKPLFEAMGKQTFYSGPKPDSAFAIKLANNFVLGCAVEAMAEGFSLTRKYGVDPQIFFEVMTGGLFAAPAYKVYGKIMVDQSFDKVGFSAMLGLKDANLIMEAANIARVPLPSCNAYRDRLLGAIAHGEGDKDWAVMAREQGRASGLE